MQQQKMEELSVSELMQRYNLIIPEIQREYVWGNNADVVNTFIEDIKTAYDDDKKAFDTYLKSLKDDINAVSNDSDIENAYSKFIANRFMNIGFLYSYRPNYFFGEGYQEDAFLIDGQQRFTTLFLALFYFSLIENKEKEFNDIFNIDESKERISFDYKVRDLTHDFIIQLISKCKDVTNIENQTWFLNDFKSDVTISSMIKTLKTLKKFHDEFKHSDGNDEAKPEISYFDFISNNIKFWHFKTEATSQGEELYITMNSRGKNLSDNEILKAHLFEDANDKLKWGEKWEKWQDFFWKHRGEKNVNADKGFNEFLRMVQIIEMVKSNKLKKKDITENVNEFIVSNKKLEIDKLPKLAELEKYFTAYKYMVEKASDFYEKYEEKNYLTSSNKKPKDYFRILPVITLLISLIKFEDESKEYLTDNINEDSILRFVRFFYNVSRKSKIDSKTQMISSIKLMLEYGSEHQVNYDVCGLIDYQEKRTVLIDDEEILKLNLYKSQPNDIKREELEELFWSLEDNKANSGEIGHLIQLLTTSDVEINSFEYKQIFDYKSIEFDFEKFKDIKEKFLKFGIKEDKINTRLQGNLIPTSVYNHNNDRIKFEKGINNYNIVRNNDFLKMVWEINDLTLDEFLENKEKKFFSNFDKEKLYNIDDRKIQLYTYFVIISNFTEQGWKLGKGDNFRMYDKKEDKSFNTLFSDKIQFQHYISSAQYAEYKLVEISQLKEEWLNDLIECAKNS